MSEMRKLKKLRLWLECLAAIKNNYKAYMYVVGQWNDPSMRNPDGSPTAAKDSLMEFRDMFAKFLGMNLVELMGGSELGSGKFFNDEDDLEDVNNSRKDFEHVAR